MKINLKQLFSIVGESKAINYSIAADELSGIKGYEFSSPIEVTGKIYNRAGIVYLEYSVEFALLITCDRCLKELIRVYNFDFDHIVVPSVNSNNDDYIIADGASIELNEVAITDLLMRLPTKNLCKDDCKGLCVECGCDLNESECNCLN